MINYVEKENNIGIKKMEIFFFEGEFVYNYKIKGKMYINEELDFDGEFLYNKKWNGKGYDENGDIIYELINGKGNVIEYNNEGGIEYEGEYLNGKRNGKGKELDWNRNLIYEGEYLNGKRWNGIGMEYDYLNGKVTFEGKYINGEKKGK